jgi:hypothetical protein
MGRHPIEVEPAGYQARRGMWNRQRKAHTLALLQSGPNGRVRPGGKVEEPGREGDHREEGKRAAEAKNPPQAPTSQEPNICCALEAAGVPGNRLMIFRNASSARLLSFNLP